MKQRLPVLTAIYRLDKEELAHPDDPAQMELNTIKITFRWLTGFGEIPQKPIKNKKPETESSEDEGVEDPPKPEEPETRYIHEKIAEKIGHSGCVVLGPPIRREKTEPTKKKPKWTYRLGDQEPITFIFHHAPIGEPLFEVG